jgi:hypothetical protein
VFGDRFEVNRLIKPARHTEIRIVPGATAGARLYSLVESAKANGIEPHAYLSQLFANLPAATSADHFEYLLHRNVTRTLEGTK